MEFEETYAASAELARTGQYGRALSVVSDFETQAKSASDAGYGACLWAELAARSGQFATRIAAKLAAAEELLADNPNRQAGVCLIGTLYECSRGNQVGAERWTTKYAILRVAHPVAVRWAEGRILFNTAKLSAMEGRYAKAAERELRAIALCMEFDPQWAQGVCLRVLQLRQCWSHLQLLNAGDAEHWLARGEATEHYSALWSGLLAACRAEFALLRGRLHEAETAVAQSCADPEGELYRLLAKARVEVRRSRDAAPTSAEARALALATHHEWFLPVLDRATCAVKEGVT